MKNIHESGLTCISRPENFQLGREVNNDRNQFLQELFIKLNTNKLRISHVGQMLLA